MKVIIVIKPARGRAYNLLRHCYLPNGRQPNEVESLSESNDRVYGLINGIAEGGLVRDAGTDAHSLIADLPHNRAEVRHVVISMEETSDSGERRQSYEALADLCEQFAEKYAPGTPFVGIIHQDRLHPHAHLIFKNSDGKNENAIVWNRDQLAEMQSMEWVTEDTRNIYSIQSGRSCGRTQREGTGLPYPLASLDAWKLATATIEQLENYEHANIITIKRSAPSGEAQSLAYNNRLIKLATIRQLAAIRAVMGRQGRPVSPRRKCRRILQGPSIS